MVEVNSCPLRQRREAYSPYSFLSLALNGVERSASRSGRALPPRKDTRYPLDTRQGGFGND
jgi:hypothetical protein